MYIYICKYVYIYIYIYIMYIIQYICIYIKSKERSKCSLYKLIYGFMVKTHEENL